MGRGRTKSVTDEEIYQACLDADEPFGVCEIAETVPIGKERTRGRLNELVEQGTLAQKRIGQTNVYWLNGY